MPDDAKPESSIDLYPTHTPPTPTDDITRTTTIVSTVSQASGAPDHIEPSAQQVNTASDTRTMDETARKAYRRHAYHILVHLAWMIIPLAIFVGATRKVNKLINWYDLVNETNYNNNLYVVSVFKDNDSTGLDGDVVIPLSHWTVYTIGLFSGIVAYLSLRALLFVSGYIYDAVLLKRSRCARFETLPAPREVAILYRMKHGRIEYAWQGFRCAWRTNGPIAKAQMLGGTIIPLILLGYILVRCWEAIQIVNSTKLVTPFCPWPYLGNTWPDTGYGLTCSRWVYDISLDPGPNATRMADDGSVMWGRSLPADCETLLQDPPNFSKSTYHSNSSILMDVDCGGRWQAQTYASSTFTTNYDYGLRDTLTNFKYVADNTVLQVLEDTATHRKYLIVADTRDFLNATSFQASTYGIGIDQCQTLDINKCHVVVNEGTGTWDCSALGLPLSVDGDHFTMHPYLQPDGMLTSNKLHIVAATSSPILTVLNCTFSLSIIGYRMFHPIWQNVLALPSVEINYTKEASLVETQLFFLPMVPNTRVGNPHLGTTWLQRNTLQGAVDASTAAWLSSTLNITDTRAKAANSTDLFPLGFATVTFFTIANILQPTAGRRLLGHGYWEYTDPRPHNVLLIPQKELNTAVYPLVVITVLGVSMAGLVLALLRSREVRSAIDANQRKRIKQFLALARRPETEAELQLKCQLIRMETGNLEWQIIDRHGTVATLSRIRPRPMHIHSNTLLGEGTTYTRNNSTAESAKDVIELTELSVRPVDSASQLRYNRAPMHQPDFGAGSSTTLCG